MGKGNPGRGGGGKKKERGGGGGDWGGGPRTWTADQASIVTDRTKEMCTPSPRCLPEHSRHMKMPYDTDAHCGFFCLQSEKTGR